MKLVPNYQNPRFIYKKDHFTSTLSSNTIYFAYLTSKHWKEVSAPTVHFQYVPTKNQYI